LQCEHARAGRGIEEAYLIDRIERHARPPVPEVRL
jgi:hypothetical protein